MAGDRARLAVGRPRHDDDPFRSAERRLAAGESEEDILAARAAAQTSSTLTGIVTDNSGGAVPGVTVTATNQATNVNYTGVTNEAGTYVITSVPIAAAVLGPSSWPVIGFLACAYAARELLGLPLPLFDRRQQVPDWWRTFYGPHVAASLYGAGLGMGGFEWDLRSGELLLDDEGLALFDLRREEFDNRPQSLAVRVPPGEGHRLDIQVSQALKNGDSGYGAYFRVRLRDGSLHWRHTQGHVLRDGTGRPRHVVGIVRDATRELSDSTAHRERVEAEADRRRRTSVVQGTTAALAHARTVADVIDVLSDAQGLAHLGASHLVMGLVEAGRIRLVAEGPPEGYVPGTRLTRVDEAYPMSEAVRTLSPRYIETPEEFAASYPLLWPHIEHLGIASAAYLPLIAQAKPLGVLGLLYQDRTGFTQEERTVLVALGSSIAQSLQRAMFYEQEKDLAQGLQQAMLPRSIPGVPGADIHRVAVWGNHSATQYPDITHATVAGRPAGD